jgi:hypothetical protein
MSRLQTFKDTMFENLKRFLKKELRNVLTAKSYMDLLACMLHSVVKSNKTSMHFLKYANIRFIQ